jgi:tetratricopeptide (TPR) repeat protein
VKRSAGRSKITTSDIPTDDIDLRLDQLLQRWEELCQQGASPSAEDLCSTCPELAGELARRIALLRAFDPLLTDRVLSTAGQSGSGRAGGPSRESATARAEYLELRFHAAGGLGEIFTARDAQLNRDIALKFLKPARDGDPESRRRFLQEAEITSRLEHPGVVPIYTVGTDGSGAHCYAMRFIRGATLQDAIDAFHAALAAGRDLAQRSLARRELLNRFVSVCSTVAYAHSRGILHRDLKPRNILLGKYDETLVMDWGLAKPFERDDAAAGAAEEALTPRSGSGTPTLGMVGTLAYMSPEQAQERPSGVGPASDIFSLGAILYAILTGAVPYGGGPHAAVIEKVKRCQFPAPRQIKPEAPRALEAICLKAMMIRPADRYATALALAADVKRWLADEPVAAWREPASVRARRWGRRHRTAMAVVVVALLAGVLGLAAVAVVQAQANRELTVANAATTKAKNEAMAALDETTKAKKATEDALAQSEESRRQAEESRKHSEAVSEFLVDAFRSPDPSQDGLQVTVADVLDRAGERLDRGLEGSPEIQGVLLDAVGRTYSSLGLYEKAVSMFTKAVTMREAALGRDHPVTLGSCNNLALAYHEAGRLPEAIALHETTLRRREAALGSDHPDTLQSRVNLAIAFYSAGRLAEAIALQDRTRKLHEAKLGPDHLETLRSRTNLAATYYSAGRLSEAIALGAATLKLYESKLGTDHPDTLSTRSNLAAAYLAVGRTIEAIALSEGTLRLRQAKLGPDHPDTLKSRNNVAIAYQSAGRFSEAIELLEATLERCLMNLRLDHPDSLLTRINLAATYLAAGRTVEAIALHEETSPLCEAKLGPDHQFTLTARTNLADAYQAAGRAIRAIALHEATLQRKEAKLGPDHPDTLESRAALASAYESLGRWVEAEALYRDVLARRRNAVPVDSPLVNADLAALARNLLEQSRWSEAEPLLRQIPAIGQNVTPDDWVRYEAMSLLGGAFLGQGRHAEAEPLIVAGYEGMSAREVRIPVPQRSRFREAAERVVHLYEEWGKPAKAAAWKAKVGMPDLPVEVFAWL